MDTLNIILIAAAGFGLIALAWLGGYQLGQAGIDSERASATAAIKNERALANRRVNALLEELNKYKPRLRYRKVDPRRVGKKRYLNSRLKEVA